LTGRYPTFGINSRDQRLFRILVAALFAESLKRAFSSESAFFHISRADEKWFWTADSCPFALSQTLRLAVLVGVVEQ
jgi:hypothetical protein